MTQQVEVLTRVGLGLDRDYLNCTQRVQYVRIVADVSRESSAFMLAAHHELDDELPVKGVERIDQEESTRTPVDTTHSEMLCHSKLKGLAVLADPLYVRAMQIAH